MAWSFAGLDNPYENFVDDQKKAIFSEKFEEHHVVLQELFEGLQGQYT